MFYISFEYSIPHSFATLHREDIITFHSYNTAKLMLRTYQIYGKKTSDLILCHNGIYIGRFSTHMTDMTGQVMGAQGEGPLGE